MSFWAQRSIFITGCSGFLGSWLTVELLRRGARVAGLMRNPARRPPSLNEYSVDRFVPVQGSIGDYPVIERALSDHGIDTVFHLASQSIVGLANKSPSATFETNIKGTWTLLEACRQHDSITRIVTTSSDKAYGNHDVVPYTEEYPLQGDHPYDVSKSCGDLITQTFNKTYGLPVCTARCSHVYGPGDLNFDRLVPGTIRSVLNGDAPVIRSNGLPVRDYVYIEDIVNAHLLLAEKMDDERLHGRAYNFGTGTPISVINLTHAILKAADREDLVPVILSQSGGEIDQQFLTSERARKELGWSNVNALEEQLPKTIDWYRDHLIRQGRAI